MITIGKRVIREHNRLYKIWMRLLWRIQGKESPLILMLHGFRTTREDCRNAFELSTVSFERLMRYLMDNRWIAMSSEELKHMVFFRKWKPNHFYVTFDDTFDTVYTEAYPVLHQFKIPFTLFITKDLVDTPGYITMSHLRELARDPLCTIGAHGLQHTVFRNLSVGEMEEQCQEGRRWLEKELGVSVTWFAFPYGRIVEVSDRNRNQMDGMGYEMAFSAIEGSIKSVWYTGRFFLPRVNVSERFVDDMMVGRFPRFKDCEGR